MVASVTPSWYLFGATVEGNVEAGGPAAKTRQMLSPPATGLPDESAMVLARAGTADIVSKAALS